MKYKAMECTCWLDYPNPMHKKKNQWKCVDCYTLVRERKGSRLKTKCKLITEDEKKGKIQP